MRTFTRSASVFLGVLALASLVYAAGDEQWLQYRTSAQTAASGITVKPLTLDFVTTAPEGVALPDNAGVDPRFIKWQTPMVKAGFIWMALTRSRTGGVYDRLFIDSKCEGTLKNAAPVAPTASQEAYSQFGPAKIVFPGSDGAITYHVNLVSYDYPQLRRIMLSSACWYEGTIKLAGKDVKCTLIDYNSNGTFDDVSADPEDSDRIGLGAGTDYSVSALGKYVSFDNALYHPAPSRDGASIVLTAATNVPMGTITVPAGITGISIAGENGQLNLKPVDGKAQAPAGKWVVRGWQMDKHDKLGVKWALTGSQAPQSSAFEIAEGKETAVDVGEPIVATVMASASGDSYTFQDVIKGRLGETVQMTQNNNLPPAPKLRIKNEDASYDKTFTFQYG